MKRIPVLSAICLLSLTSFAFGQVHTQHISFDDQVGPGNAGTYSPTDHFGVDLYLTFAGYNSNGFSLWLETTANAAPNIFLAGLTANKTFDDPGNAVFPLSFTYLLSNGLYTTANPSDLGSTFLDIHRPPAGPGTYFVGHLSIDLSGLAPGTYVLQSSSTNPHPSEVTSFDGTTFADEYLPTATYTITVVPEPSTLALLVLVATGLGIVTRHRAVSKKTAIAGSGDSHRS